MIKVFIWVLRIRDEHLSNITVVEGLLAWLGSTLMGLKLFLSGRSTVQYTSQSIIWELSQFHYIDIAYRLLNQMTLLSSFEGTWIMGDIWIMTHKWSVYLNGYEYFLYVCKKTTFLQTHMSKFCLRKSIKKIMKLHK